MMGMEKAIVTPKSSVIVSVAVTAACTRMLWLFEGVTLETEWLVREFDPVPDLVSVVLVETDVPSVLLVSRLVSSAMAI